MRKRALNYQAPKPPPFMRKNVFGRQLKRDSNERKALFKTLLSSLVMYERIETSEAKAKAIKSDADKLITKAKKGGLHAYRLLEPKLSTEAVKKVVDTIAPRFTDRQGGYTRIIRVGRRLKDNSSQVILEWTEKAMPGEENKESQAEKKPANLKQTYKKEAKTKVKLLRKPKASKTKKLEGGKK